MCTDLYNTRTTTCTDDWPEYLQRWWGRLVKLSEKRLVLEHKLAEEKPGCKLLLPNKLMLQVSKRI